MKIIAECPDEDNMLKKAEQLLIDKGFPLVSAETFEEAFLGQVLSSEISFGKHEMIKNWTPSQRLWFLEVMKDFLSNPKAKEFIKEYDNYVGIYESIFQEETNALHKAVNDFNLFLTVKKNCILLRVNNYKKLKQYLNCSIVQGKGQAIEKVCAYYDEKFSQYVIELNSLKIPFSYKAGRIQEEFTIYGWCDSNCSYSFEFLKPELLLHLEDRKKDTLERQIFESKKIENMSAGAKKVSASKKER